MNEEKRVLVIIDMQKDFQAALGSEIIKEILKQINISKGQNLPIVFVRYQGEGEIVPCLLKRAKKRMVFFITKDDCDGSREIISLLKKKKIKSRKLRICGVNTDECVQETVKGLLDREPSIDLEVVKKGCASFFGTGEDLWKNYPKKENLKII